MVFQIDGASDRNKGAQLMMHAVLQEIAKRHPNSIVYINSENTDLSMIIGKYPMTIKKRQSNFFRKLIAQTRIADVAFKIYKPLSWIFSLRVPTRGVDVLINIGGFQFGDQWKHNSNKNGSWKWYLSTMKSYGTKIIFMPQAFGPFENKYSKEMVKILDENVDILIAREDVSYEYIKSVGLSKSKLLLYPDFTGLVKEEDSKMADSIENEVCIIPNYQMILQNSKNEDEYLTEITKLINYVRKKGVNVFMLNHEGTLDQILCEKINNKLESKIKILASENALITKGIIKKAYFVISSRFHGVANSLNSGVPCLATSWSHKYKMLLSDFGVSDYVIDYHLCDDTKNKIDSLLNKSTNKKVRNLLTDSKQHIDIKCNEMWNYIWNFL